MQDNVNDEGLISKAKMLLRVDSFGGLLVGAGVLVLKSILADWYGLSLDLIFYMGLANLAYGSFSGILLLYASLKTLPPKPLLYLLVLANIVWLGVCIFIVISNSAVISTLGVALVLFEGLYVASLGLVEFKVFKQLSQ